MNRLKLTVWLAFSCITLAGFGAMHVRWAQSQKVLAKTKVERDNALATLAAEAERSAALASQARLFRETANAYQARHSQLLAAHSSLRLQYDAQRRAGSVPVAALPAAPGIPVDPASREAHLPAHLPADAIIVGEADVFACQVEAVRLAALQAWVRQTHEDSQ